MALEESLDGPALTDGVGFDVLGREDGARRELAEHDGSGNPTRGKDAEGFGSRRISASQVLMLCCPRSFSEVGSLVSLPSEQVKVLEFFSATSCGNPSRRFVF